MVRPCREPSCRCCASRSPSRSPAAAAAARIAPTGATLLLDFAPNAVHAGIYLATRAATTTREGVHARGPRPGGSTDALKLLQPAGPTWRSSTSTTSRSPASRARRRRRHRDRPAPARRRARPPASAAARPRGPPRRRTGVPTTTPCWSPSVAATAATGRRSQDDDRLRAVPALLAGRATRATAFWNAKGVALKSEAAGHPRVPRRRLRRARLPRARPLGQHARRSTRTRRSSAATTARSSAATFQAQNDPQSAVSDARRRRTAAWTATPLTPARRRLPRLRGRRSPLRRAAPGQAAEVGGLGPRVRDRERSRSTSAPGVRPRPRRARAAGLERQLRH